MERGRNALFFYDKKHNGNKIYSLREKRLTTKAAKIYKEYVFAAFVVQNVIFFKGDASAFFLYGHRLTFFGEIL
jgi:hypothetical protein